MQNSLTACQDAHKPPTRHRLQISQRFQAAYHKPQQRQPENPPNPIFRLPLTIPPKHHALLHQIQPQPTRPHQPRHHLRRPLYAQRLPCRLRRQRRAGAHRKAGRAKQAHSAATTRKQVRPAAKAWLSATATALPPTTAICPCSPTSLTTYSNWCAPNTSKPMCIGQKHGNPPR